MSNKTWSLFVLVLLVTPHNISFITTAPYLILEDSPNEPPVADAGLDQTVIAGDEVQFDGSGSYDPDGRWSLMVVDSGERMGSANSIAMDSQDNPHISYRDYQGRWVRSNYSLKHAWWDGSTWNNETLEEAGNWIGGTSIAFDSNGIAKIAFAEYPGKRSELKYASQVGGTWQFEVFVAGNDTLGPPKMALDSNDFPHISYDDFTNGSLNYARWNGSAWFNETVDRGGASGTSIALDSRDYPHISYIHNIENQLRHAWWNGSGWEIEIVDAKHKADLSPTSIAIDENDNPHIGYFIDGYYDDVGYAAWNGSAWNIEYPDVLGRTTWSISLALDSMDNPHMAYYEKMSDEVRYARRVGGLWEVEVVDTECLWSTKLSLAMDRANNPHISYRKNAYDPADDDFLMYATTRGRILSYDWDFGDGLPHSTEVKPRHVYTTPGVYNVSLTVTDTGGASDTDNCTVTVLPKDSPPVADSGGPYLSQEGTALAFDGSGSSDPEGGTLSFTWDFDSLVDSDGDGNFINDLDATGPTPTHTYYDNSNYTVTVTVTDDTGQSDTSTSTATILNVAPTAQTNGPFQGDEPHTVQFTGTFTDPGTLDTHTFQWDFDFDGITFNVDSTQQNPTHQWLDDFNGSVAFKVTDDDGGWGMDVTHVTVNNLPPNATANGPYNSFEGSPVQFTGDHTDPGPLDTHTYEWDFGYDGITFNPEATGNPYQNTWFDDHTGNIALRVTDDDGGWDLDVTSVTIVNVPPIADAGDDKEGYEVSTFTFNGSFYDPGAGDSHIFEWDFDYDGTTFNADSTGQTATHTWADDFDGLIALRVTDDDGGSDIDTAHVLVKNVPPTVTLEVLPIEVDAFLRIAGEKWHDVSIELFEDGVLIANGTLVRYPGSPDEQMLDLSGILFDYSKQYTATVTYTPDDDPINGQPQGANPCWIILNFSEGQELWMHHTFNVNHPDTYVWEVDLTAAILSHGMTFEATAFDPGADELTFTWDFGDGTNVISFHSNRNGTYPVQITELINHAFPGSGTYVVVLTVEDDDGGVGTATLTIIIP
jgi:PKD repeat protein